MGYFTTYDAELDPKKIFERTVDRYENAQDYADDVKDYVTNAIDTLVTNGIENLSLSDITDTLQSIFNVDDSGISGINPDEPAAPIVANIEVGEPTAAVPAIPQLEDLNLEDLNYEEVLIDLSSPEATFNYVEETYTSNLAEQLENKVLSDLLNGGTGLGADVEAAIWDRARSRQEAENEQTYDEALNFWSSRGFTIPPGMLNGTLIEARNNIDQNNTNINNDILVQESNLAQNNTQFIITTAVQIEKNLMDNFNQHRNRALEAAKTAVQVIRDIYQLKVDELQARLSQQEVNAKIYEIKLNSALAKLEIKIKEHQADIEAYKAAITYYDSQVKKIIAQAEARVSTEGLKVETFKAQSGHYQAEIDAVIKSFLGKIESASAYANALNEDRKAAVQLLLGESSLTSDQLSALASIAGRLAAASLTSVSAGTNIGVSHTQSDSKSRTEQDSSSNSYSVMHNHIYQESTGSE